MDAVADPFTRNHWHVVGAADEVRAAARKRTQLLGVPLAIVDGRRIVRDDGAELPILERFGYLWTTLGDAPIDLFEIAEYAEPDRRSFNAASIAVRTSAGRAVENFFDFSHFPFIHPGFLGDPAYAAVPAYEVEASANGVTATQCRSYQPRAAAMSDQPLDVEYAYRVPHPCCVLLYKTNPAAITRRDVIGLFVQPLDEERVAAHMFLSLLDDVTSQAEIRAFQQTIFGQDKPILEGQRPRRLPLDLRVELPVRCDALSIAYRRWLQTVRRHVWRNSRHPAGGAHDMIRVAGRCRAGRHSSRRIGGARGVIRPAGGARRPGRHAVVMTSSRWAAPKRRESRRSPLPRRPRVRAFPRDRAMTRVGR